MNIAPAIVRLDRQMTARQRAEVAVFAGRRRGVTAGSHIADLVSLDKSIALCNRCAPRFDARQHGYAVDRHLPQVRGKCDGCREYRDPMTMLVPPSLSR